MSLRFLLDVHLPLALAAGIRAAGHTCDQVGKLIPSDASDLEIAHLANATGAVVVSKDVDFVDLVHRGALRTALVRIRLLNMMAPQTCAAVLPLLPRIVASIEAGERIIEIR